MLKVNGQVHLLALVWIKTDLASVLTCHLAMLKFVSIIINVVIMFAIFLSHFIAHSDAYLLHE